MLRNVTQCLGLFIYVLLSQAEVYAVNNKLNKLHGTKQSLDKLTVAQLLKFPTFYGTRSLITVFRRAPH